MSVKPTDSGRFAATAIGIDASNISAPSSGLRDTGFPNNYVPPAGEFNYLENIHYRWQQWLFDGDCAFNNVTAAGTLGVTGAATLQSTLGVSGVATFLNMTCNGTLTAGAISGHLVTGLLECGAGMQADINQNITVGGTGQYLHGTRTLLLGPTAFQAEGGAMTNYAWSPAGMTGTFSGNFAVASITLPALKRIPLNGIRVYLHDAATVQMQCFLIRTTNLGVSTTIGTSSTSASNNTDQTITIVMADTALTTGQSYTIRVATIGAASVKVYKAEVDFYEA